MAQSVSKRIARDRGGAQFWASLAALPVWAMTIGIVVLAGMIAFSPSNDPEDGASPLIMGAVILVFAYLFSIVSGWTYASVRSALTPQRIQAMWLRRFQAEGGDTFRTSRVIDRLSRDGISALTLQDRDVQLSFEQRRNRLAPVFWFLFLPLTVMLGFGARSAWRDAQQAAEDFRPTAENFGDAIGQAIGNALATGLVLILIIIVAAAALMLTTLLIMALAAAAGPIGAALSRKRDDYKRLPRLLQHLQRGKRRGASVVRISDAHWRDAVVSSLGAVDVAIIDLTSVSDNIAWEISEAVKACGAAGLVFICSDRDGRMLAPQAKAAVRTSLGRDPGAIVFYPARRGGDAKRFARDLRQAIYSAADAKAV